MKVLMISGSYPNMKCGVGDYTKVLANFINKTGIGIKVLTTKNEKVVSDGICEPAILNWNLQCIKEIYNYVNKNNINIIHIQYPTKGYGYKIGINLLPLYIKMKDMVFQKRIRIITTLHEFSQSHILRKISIIPLVLFSDKIILTNDEEKKIILKLFLFLMKDKFEVINIGSNILPDKSSENNENKLYTNNHTISYFGFIRPDKGLETLLRAIVLTKVYTEDDFKLNILAELDDSDEYHCKIRNLLKQLNINKNKIKITGYLTESQVSEYLKASNLCVLPYRDGLTYRRGSFIASVVHNVPVLSTYTKLTSPDLLEIFRDYLVKPNDVVGLSRNIDKFFYDMEYRNKLIAKTNQIKNLFDWEKIADKHKSLYYGLGLRD